jgi:hypothetical protein
MKWLPPWLVVEWLGGGLLSGPRSGLLLSGLLVTLRRRLVQRRSRASASWRLQGYHGGWNDRLGS